jgi:hypothetical protein
LIIGSAANLAQAQLSPDAGGRTALENARGGAVRGRSPGNMVSAGVAQATSFGRGAAIGVDVTETEEPSTVFGSLLAESIDFLFGQVNDAIDQFVDLLLLRAGATGLSSFGFSLPPSASDE